MLELRRDQCHRLPSHQFYTLQPPRQPRPRPSSEIRQYQRLPVKLYLAFETEMNEVNKLAQRRVQVFGLPFFAQVQVLEYLKCWGGAAWGGNIYVFDSTFMNNFLVPQRQKISWAFSRERLKCPEVITAPPVDVPTRSSHQGISASSSTSSQSTLKVVTF